ncbi:MAG: tetratricopeptide repeat protein, partial [Sphingobacteriales bacterium]
YQIKRLLKFKNDIKKLHEAIQLYYDENYKQSIDLLESLKHDFINSSVLLTNVSACIQIKDYDRAKAFYSQFINSPVFQKLDAGGFFNLGVVESNLAENDLALNYYTRSLELDCNYINSLCNRGYTYNLIENYAGALNDFNKAIEIDPDSSYAYSNRAFTEIKLGLFEEALSDINKSISLDGKNSYAYRNLGVYYLELGDYPKAMEQFLIACELYPDTHMINDYINIVKEKLKEIKAV